MLAAFFWAMISFPFGDNNQRNDAAGCIDRIRRHADSIGIRIR